jgi:hypothetical protein
VAQGKYLCLQNVVNFYSAGVVTRDRRTGSRDNVPKLSRNFLFNCSVHGQNESLKVPDGGR